MRSIHVVAMVCVLAVGLVAARRLAPGAAVAEEAPKIRWHDTYEAALAAAKESGKPVMADFYTDWCGFCTRMDREVLSNLRIIETLRRFEAVKVDGEARADLVDRDGVRGYPTFLFVDAQGRDLYRASGYSPVDPFGVTLRRARAVAQAAPELARLEAKREAGDATGEELARASFLLLQAGRAERAAEAAEEALAALPADNPARAGAELDRLIARAQTGNRAALDGIEAWLGANVDHARRWEAQYEMGLGMAEAAQLAAGSRALGEVARQDAASDWGIMARYYVGLIEAALNPPRTGG